MLDRTIPPLVKPMSFTFRKPVKRVLRNGIPIYVIEGEEQNVVRVDFVFSAGQWHQAQKLQALFTCRMLREGCHGYSAAAFAERLDYYGAWLELSVAMNRTFVTLYTLKKFFAQTLELVQKMLFEPSFSDEQFELVRANNKAQFAVNMLKGDIRAVRALRRSVYGDSHPCGMQILPDDYDMLQSAHLTDFYSRYYGSCNCSIYISGNIDEEVMGLIESLFGIAPWGSGQAVPDRIYSVNPSEERRVVLVQPDAVQSSLRMGGLMMDVPDEDYLPMRNRDTVLPTVGVQKLPDRRFHRDPATREAFLEAMEATVHQLYNHPSICYWTIFNEGWGQFHSTPVYRRLKELDSSRFIDTTSGWFRGSETDVESLHVYFNGWRWLKRRYKNPLVLSEFGGYVYQVEGHIFNTEKSYGYRTCTSKEVFMADLEKLYREKILPAIPKGLCAAVYTQVSDVEDEINGMLTYDRKVCKPDADTMTAIARDLYAAIK